VAFLVVDGIVVGGNGALDAAGWVLLLCGSVLAHELVHAVVGRVVGARVRDIVLLPIGGATRTESFPERPPGELLMTG
jgi:Zn-dependent protease